MSVQISRLHATEPRSEPADSGIPAAPEVASDGERHALGAWLEIACRMIPGVGQAFAGLGDAAREGFAAQASWPRNATVDPDAEAIAHAVLDGGKATQITTGGEPGMIYLARRLHPGKGRTAVLVLKLPQPADGQRETLYKLIDWSEAWMGLAIASIGAQPASSDTLLELLNAGLSADDMKSAGTAMAICLTEAVRADSVSVGILTKDCIELLARSHTAAFDPRARANRAITAAMEEAVDEGMTVMVPAESTAPPGATRAHEALREADSLACACTLPLICGDAVVGALTLVRHRGDTFAQTERLLLNAAADAVANVLEHKRAAGMSLRERLAIRCTDHARRLAGPGYLSRKLLTGSLVLILAVLLFVDGNYHVAAPATVEGRVERTLVAPIEGYVASAPARAGDAVRKGDLLAVIDTRALEFERRKLASERAEAEKTLRQAVAELDRPKVAISKARLGKASSQLELVDAQIDRARVTAPFEGMIISGDLSRALGAPVNRGDVLFEIAPLDDYRVELEVDEHDIAGIAPGQNGHLALTALPGEQRTFTVEKIIGVAVAADGRNVFKVEAVLDGDVGLLRPGMRGVGKVEAGEHRLLWVWTHDLIDRVRLWLWSRIP